MLNIFPGKSVGFKLVSLVIVPKILATAFTRNNRRNEKVLLKVC